MVYAENILICIAVPLAIALMFLRGAVRRFDFAFLSGMVTCLLAAYIGGFFAQVSGMGAENVSIFLSPIIEEIMKLLPVLFYLSLYEPKDAELLQAAVGIGAGFATFENCCYVLTSGAQNLSYVLIRGSAVGVMHLVSMVALAFGLHLLKRYKVFTFSGIMGALSLAVTFHATYNLLVSEPGVSTYIGYALPILFALILYSQTHRYIERGE
ncbi:MAG: PrsW family intramembrane metalloprotease [Lachnospiraceae bacterium]|nr:PrsW family intramembrane metalloprotease [Lachnospiraceae bacterium]MBP5732227.1 PrsW family intramembrane metalloprotease [Lachnospiraceae bacterium]